MSAWHIIRHPETGGVGVIGDSSLPIHKALGWIRVGEVAEGEKDHVDKAAYTDAPDLDARKPADKATKPNNKES